MCSEPHCDLIWMVKENFGWAVSVVLDNFNCEADLGLGPSPVKDQWRLLSRWEGSAPALLSIGKGV